MPSVDPITSSAAPKPDKLAIVHVNFARPTTIEPVLGIRADGGVFSVIIQATVEWA